MSPTSGAGVPEDAAAPAATPRPRRPRLIDDPELLRTRLRETPDAPGVYLMRDLDTRVAYVGKAASLRNRLRSYFTGIDGHPHRTRQLVERVFDFEVVRCASPQEALLLENLLIKRYRPRFNVRLKDDKNYLYLKIPRPGQVDALAPGTAREEPRASRGGEAGRRAAEFPRPYYSRRMHRDGARYFGPYTSAQSLRTTVRTLRTILPFRTCSDEVFRRGRVCLDYHIHRCAGPCEGHIDAAAYATLLDEVSMVMEGRSSTLTAELRRRMREASESLDFEQAGRYRDRLRAIDRLQEKQATVVRTPDDRDAVAVALAGGTGMVAVLSSRQGRVAGVDTHALEGVAELGPEECLESFVGQYYGEVASVPRTVLVSHDLPGQTLLQEFLSERRGGPVEVRRPARGTPRELVEQAQQTAASALQQALIKADFDEERTGALLADLADRLGLAEPPRRIECYDISNTMGTNSVGSMVVFEDGRPRPAHYRHFAIRTVEGADDFRSMQETLRRRFGRHLRGIGASVDDDAVPVEDPDGANGGERPAQEPGVAEGEGAPAPRGRRRGAATPAKVDDSFLALPDLVIIDGGRGQLNAAVAVLVELGLERIEIAGLAKQNEELFLPGRGQPVVIPKDSPTLFLVQRVRDEAHRFAITRHRARRGREALRSQLDVVSGLGPARRRALLRHFGSIDGVKEASVEEIAALPGMPLSVARRIKELL